MGYVLVRSRGPEPHMAALGILAKNVVNTCWNIVQHSDQRTTNEVYSGLLDSCDLVPLEKLTAHHRQTPKLRLGSLEEQLCRPILDQADTSGPKTEGSWGVSLSAPAPKGS
jgi:hypothetical protein